MGPDARGHEGRKRVRGAGGKLCSLGNTARRVAGPQGRGDRGSEGKQGETGKTNVLQDALKPYVEHVRTQVFGDSRPPTPTRAAAAKWIAEQAAPQASASGQQGQGHVERAQAALDKYNRIDTSGYYAISFRSHTQHALFAGARLCELVLVARGTLLSRIRDAMFVMEEAVQAAFPREALLEHLLTGKPLPRVDSVTIRRRLTLLGRAWPEGDSTAPRPQIARHYRFVIELDEDEVTEQRFRRIYQAIRLSVRKTGAKAITDFDWRLQRVVNELGGLPPRSQRRGFWAKVKRKLGTKLSEEAIRECDFSET